MWGNSKLVLAILLPYSLAQISVGVWTYGQAGGKRESRQDAVTHVTNDRSDSAIPLPQNQDHIIDSLHGNILLTDGFMTYTKTSL